MQNVINLNMNHASEDIYSRHQQSLRMRISASKKAHCARFVSIYISLKFSLKFMNLR